MNDLKDLNWEGIETGTTDVYYDICNGYFDDQIKDLATVDELVNAVRIIDSLVDYLEENELIY